MIITDDEKLAFLAKHITTNPENQTTLNTITT